MINVLKTTHLTGKSKLNPLTPLLLVNIKIHLASIPHEHSGVNDKLVFNSAVLYVSGWTMYVFWKADNGCQKKKKKYD